MKNSDWMVEEVLKILTESTLTPDQAGTSTRQGPHVSAGANGPHPVDAQKFQGEIPDEEEKKHDSLDEREQAPVKTKGEKKVTFSIPKLVPTEAWGNADSQSRQDIYKFFKKIPGRTLGEKISNINSIAQRQTNIRSTAKILATLVFFDSLSSVVKDFTPASSGFVFEGFLAALLNGSQEIARSAGGTLDIADIRALQKKDESGNLTGGYPVSLKLLTGAGSGTPIHGSYPNLVGSLAESDDDNMLYVVVLKDKAEGADELEFHEFDVNSATFLPIMSEGVNNVRHLPLHGSLLSNAKFKSLLDPRRLKEYASKVDKSGYLPLDISMNIIENDLTPIKNNSNEFFGMMKYTKGFFEKHGAGKRGQEEQPDEPQQDEINERMSQGDLGFLFEASSAPFQFSVSQARMKKLPTYKNMGKIDVRPESVRKIAERYADILENQLNQVYDNLKTLTSSVNNYFLGDSYGQRTKAADSAIASADVSKAQSQELKATATDEE
jgi:hypothetical protein